MRKNTGKVLSMILAMAMVVSSFSATFVSASTQDVVGNDARVEEKGDYSDEFHLVSDKYDDLTVIDDLDNAYKVMTMDREELDDVEYVSFTKVSGDSLVKVVKDRTDKDDDAKRSLVLKKNASGTETIRINYKGIYTDDDTDKEITARGSIEVKITANAEGSVVLGKVQDSGEVTWADNAARKLEYTNDEPDAPELVAVNDSGIRLALYMAKQGEMTGKGNAAWVKVNPYTDKDSTDDDFEGKFDLSSDKNFVLESDEDSNDALYTEAGVTRYDPDTGIFELVLRKSDEEGKKDEEIQYYAKTFTTKMEVYAPKVTVDEDGPEISENDDGIVKGNRIRENVGVGKKYRLTDNAEVGKLGSRTLLTYGSADFDDQKYNDIASEVKVVTGYELVADGHNVTVQSGNIDAIKGAVNVNVEGATIGGNVEATGEITIGEDATVNGTLKKAGTIAVQDGAKVDSIDADAADLTLDGASITNDVNVESFFAVDNEDYNNTVGGDINASTFNVEAIDGSFNAKGSMIATLDDGEDAKYYFEGDKIFVNTIDADFYPAEIEFNEASMNVAFVNNNGFDTTVTLLNEADVTVNGDVRVGVVDVEEDSILRFAGNTVVSEMNGDGMVVAPAGQLHVKTGLADVQLKLTDLAVGATAFTSDTDAVDESDFNPVGYSLKKEAISSTVDKFTVDAVSFAGLAFDKEFVTIAQGYSDTITLAAYPTGTTAPADARVMWELDGNDDYFNVVVDPNTNVATINVTGYNADDASANTATIKAYLVDEDGYEIEDYVAATCKVTAVAQPEIRGTLKADTTSYTLPVGGIYDIQFSVTGVDATPVVTDSRTGSVFQLTNLGGNKYRVTGVNEGTAYVVATVGDTRVSVAITVDNDATQGGEKGNNVSEIR